MRLMCLLLAIVVVSAACNLSQNEVADLPTVPPSAIIPTAKATRTPIPFGTQQVQLTPVGSVATLALPPLTLGIPTTVNTVSLNTNTTPDQAVKNYYALVSQGRYDLGWSLLTDAFKQKFNCCAPNYNYTDYVKWWDSVNTVEFGNVKTVSQNGDHAVVYVEIFYVMNNGQRSSLVGDPYIALVYDPTLAAWRFDDKRATA